MIKCNNSETKDAKKLDNKDILKNLGQKIREARKKQKISQEKLGFISKLDRTYIGSVERGERNISVINLYKIAKALNTPITSFFTPPNHL